MNSAEYDFQILKLSENFYNTYPHSIYSEILEKKQRAYNCIVLESQYEYFICIPYRTEIRHNYAYHFTCSIRSRKHKSGLDYTKMVIIKDIDYLSSVQAVIDNDEFKETVSNINKIQKEAYDFLNQYIEHISGINTLHTQEYKRRYQYSPLKYFHNELGLTNIPNNI